MRKILNIVAALVFTVSLHGATYSSALSEARAVQMENYKAKESAIFERVESLIMRTSNFSTTRSEVQQAWNLPSSYWNNFAKESCAVAGAYCVGNLGTGINLIIDPVNKQLKLSNSLGSSPNAENIRLYSRDRTDEILVDVTNNAIRPFSVALSNMYELYKLIISNPLNVISTTTPTDTSKTWYKPNGHGGYDIYSFIGGVWKKVGLADSDGKSEIFAATEAELQAIPCMLGTKGYVGDGTLAKQYVCGLGGTWELMSSAATGGLYTGSATLKEVACDLFSKDGGSIAEVSPIAGQYLSLSTTVEFVKFDNLTTGGYWKQNSATPAFVVFKDIAGAIAHKSAFSTGTKGYICKNGGDVYEMQKTAFGRWAYVGYNFNKAATFFQSAPIDDGGYILSWDTVSARSDTYKKYFQAVGSGTSLHYASKYNYDNTVVSTADITQNIKLSPAGRYNFGTGAYNTWYLSVNDDCPTLNNCNGATTATYAGTAPSVFDSMYSWYYSPLGIIDAQPFSTLALAYASTANPQAVIVGSNVYTRGLDSNSNECYKNVANNTFYTGGAVAFPTVMVASSVVQMPTTKTCENATFTSGYLNLGSWVEVTDWTSAPYLASAVAGGKYWQKQAAGVSGRWLSTDNLVQMTKGSRTNLANPGGTTLTNISRVVGTEPRYTPSGVTYTADTSFLQWFYSTTGSTTNALLDAISTANAYTDSTAISVGYAVQSGAVLAKSGNYWYNIGTSTAVDSSLVARATANIVPIGTASQAYWAARNCSTGWSQSSKTTGQYIPTDAAVASCGYNATVGLYYDTYASMMNWTSANNYCASKNMRLPTIGETNAYSPYGVTGGLAAYPDGTYSSWSSTLYVAGVHRHWYTSGNLRADGDSFTNHVRCVIAP